MIKLHHLNRSRSKRIIWLLEALGLPYKIQAYQRDAVTHLAPAELKSIHPLGKSPLIEEDGIILAESGAIIEYLIKKYAKGDLSPAEDSADYPKYLQWLHFAESSAALPLLLRYFLSVDKSSTTFLDGYSQKEVALVLGYLNTHFKTNKWLLGKQFSAADIMLSFIVEMVAHMGLLAEYQELQRYLGDLQADINYQRANELEKQYDLSN